MSAYLYGYFGCEEGIKNLISCSVGEIELISWFVSACFGARSFSGYRLPVSAWFLIDIGAKHIGSKRGVE